VVTKAEGFEWVDEAKPGRSPKPGFVFGWIFTAAVTLYDQEATATDTLRMLASMIHPWQPDAAQFTPAVRADVRADS